MEEHTEHRSIRARKPVVYFGDEIAQYPGHSKPSRLPKAPVKPTTATQPIAQSSASSVSTAEPAVAPNPSADHSYWPPRKYMSMLRRHFDTVRI